jgi:hypothetical protein
MWDRWGQGDNLVVDNTFDFSAYYPARQACKAVGGRLPTINELQCMYTYRGTYGLNFSAGSYWWSSTEYNAGYAYMLYYNGSTDNYYKTSTYNTHCVRGW